MDIWYACNAMKENLTPIWHYRQILIFMVGGIKMSPEEYDIYAKQSTIKHDARIEPTEEYNRWRLAEVRE
ncbi:MAG: hypothetical protein ACTSQ8_26065 [Candidatus Helarchaeota archaeon]